MGVPKFTRFICERYPCLLEVLNDYQIPEFDNLYLDMNGIIHCCSHPNDADAHFRITEETIFKNIFLYVELLFRTIKPQKLFFMAVDGVAPRAKINQQRCRRFTSAKEAEVIEARARAKGETLPEGERFDSNCITPGTKFMATLNEQLRYFVIYKISTDKLWQKCKIILSGPEVPGEGEHKIMDYIRYMKSQPDHDPNTRHCLYGLDADLIMLSLCTHEPHFAVLREEVKYSRSHQKAVTPLENTKFTLLHISLLREYLEHEFECLKSSLPFPFDIEKIIDDWILMGFLVGNDFIPHLPNLHIVNGAFPALYQVYKETLPTLDGYINEAGTLNLPRFEKFMEKLSSLDVKNFCEHQADLKFFEAKTGRHPSDNDQLTPSKDIPDDNPPKKSFQKDLESLIQSTEDMLLGHSDEEDDFIDTDDSDNDTYALEFRQHKHDYYINKLDIDKVDDDVMRQQAEAYVTAIQWILHYYYDGCCSWSWYYPHHYAPFMSDIKDFKDLKFNFELASPFLPFQQLLAVLPAASRKLLPEPYQDLLTEEGSPIIDYYPGDFKTDLNGKKQEWEAVVLIPFIDEKSLLKAMEPGNAKLTAVEQKRNRHGPMSIVTYTEENLGVITAPAYFPTIENHARISLVYPREIDVPREKLRKGLLNGAKLSVYFPGFPTLQHISRQVELDKCSVKVFEQASRNENMMITILPKEAPGINELASELLGKMVFIKWPYLLQGYVVEVSNLSRQLFLIDPNKGYSPDNVKKVDFQKPGETQWKAEARSVSNNYKTRYGIIMGHIEALVRVRTLIGSRYTMTSQNRMSLEREWSNTSLYFPYHTIVRDIEVEAARNTSHKNISDIYNPKSVCFMLGHPHYGAMGEVVEPGVNHKTGRVKVAMNITSEPEFSAIQRQQEQIKMQYMAGSIAAQRLGISSHLLSRITGSILVQPNSSDNKKKQHNVGLNLKFNKRNEELPGYTKKINGQWMYSSKSVGLIRTYMQHYPQLFEKLVENVGKDIFSEDDLFSSDNSELMDVVKWLKEQPYRAVESRSFDYPGLDPDIITQLQTYMDEFVEKNESSAKTVIMQVKPHLLFKPGINSGNVPPDTQAKHRVFDRIISVKENSSVPLGYKGTIINIQKTEESSDIVYDILFDKYFIGGISFNGGANSRRFKLYVAEFINISHGMRTEQDIAGIVNTPDKTVKKKQSGVDGAQNSAFASFNSQGKFYSVSGKEKSQNQSQGTGQVKVMKKNQAQGATKEVVRAERKDGKGQTAKKPEAPAVAAESRKNEPNTEFQQLWNELQKTTTPSNPKPVIPPFAQMRLPQVPLSQPPLPSAVPDAPQDPSAFLKAILGISDDKASDQSKPPAINRLPFTFPPTPPAPTSNLPTSNAPTLVQQMFDRARQAGSENVSYCARLLNHFQLMGIGMPRYFYSTQKNLLHAQIILPDLRTFYGDLCTTYELAAESAAKKAYTELNLDNAPKPRPYFDLQPLNACLNVQPPVSVQPPVMMSPRSFPEAQKPPVRPPANWNVRMPQQGLCFNQMAPPMMGHSIPPLMSSGTSQGEVKPEVKQSAPFVPLQAQKRKRTRHPKNKSQETPQCSKESIPLKPQNTKPKENSPKISKDEKATKENEQVKGGKDNTTVAQKSHKNPRPRRSRIAANFGSSAANGGDK